MALARLLVSEPYQPTRHALIRETPFWIGRDATCQLVLTHPSVSKRHAVVRTRGDGFFVEDAGSKNGTLVNGVPAGPQALRHQDLITLGGLDLLFAEIDEKDLEADLGAEFDKIRTALRLASDLHAAGMLDAVLDQVMSGLMRLTQAERGFLLLGGPGRPLSMVRSVNIGDDELRAEAGSISSSAVERARQTGQPVAISNAADDTFFGARPSVNRLAIRTLVCVPMLDSAGAVTGLLYADSGSRQQGFTELDVEVLRSLAESASIALENARLQSEIERVLREASAALAQVENAALDESLQLSVRQALTSLSALRVKFSPDASPERRAGAVHEG